jgi:hypothetical protein
VQEAVEKRRGELPPPQTAYAQWLEVTATDREGFYLQLDGVPYGRFHRVRLEPLVSPLDQSHLSFRVAVFTPPDL